MFKSSKKNTVVASSVSAPSSKKVASQLLQKIDAKIDLIKAQFAEMKATLFEAIRPLLERLIQMIEKGRPTQPQIDDKPASLQIQYELQEITKTDSLTARPYSSCTGLNALSLPLSDDSDDSDDEYCHSSVSSYSEENLDTDIEERDDIKDVENLSDDSEDDTASDITESGSSNASSSSFAVTPDTMMESVVLVADENTEEEELVFVSASHEEGEETVSSEDDSDLVIFEQAETFSEVEEDIETSPLKEKEELVEAELEFVEVTVDNVDDTSSVPVPVPEAEDTEASQFTEELSSTTIAVTPSQAQTEVEEEDMEEVEELREDDFIHIEVSSEEAEKEQN